MSKQFWPADPATLLISRRSQDVLLTATTVILPRRASRPSNSRNSRCCSDLGGRNSHWTIRRSHQWCRWHCTLCINGSPDRDPCGSVPQSFPRPAPDPESCNGLSMGRGGCDRRLFGDPYRCSEEQSKNTPATRMKKALLHRLGKFPQQITPLLVIGAKMKTSRCLPAGDLTAPSLPPWSVGPVHPGASPPERSASPSVLQAALH